VFVKVPVDEAEVLEVVELDVRLEELMVVEEVDSDCVRVVKVELPVEVEVEVGSVVTDDVRLLVVEVVELVVGEVVEVDLVVEVVEEDGEESMVVL